MDNYYGNICYCRRCNGVVHTIKKGDTLYLISKYYKVPIGEIMGANRNINIYNLQIGDEICIPVRRPEPSEDTDDTSINNMGRNMGNSMNSSTMNSSNMNGSNMNSNTMNGNNLMGEDVMSDEMLNITTDMASDNMNDTEPDNGMNNRAVTASAKVSGVNGLKVSELIGEKDMTVEELAGLLKKYM